MALASTSRLVGRVLGLVTRQNRKKKKTSHFVINIQPGLKQLHRES